MILLLIFGAFLAAMGVIGILKRRKNDKIFTDSLAAMGLAPQDLVPAGEYVSGDLPVGNTFIIAWKKDILLGVRDSVTNKFRILATIPKTALTSVNVGEFIDRNGKHHYGVTICWKVTGAAFVKLRFSGSDAEECAYACREYLSNYMD